SMSTPSQSKITSSTGPVAREVDPPFERSLLGGRRNDVLRAHAERAPCDSGDLESSCWAAAATATWHATCVEPIGEGCGVTCEHFSIAYGQRHRKRQPSV